MPLPRPGFFIDPRGRRIAEVRELSRRPLGHLGPDQALEHLADPAVEVFRWDEREELHRVVDRAAFREELAGHVAADPEDFDIAAFENGYCFVVWLWKATGGAKILVCQYNH